MPCTAERGRPLKGAQTAGQERGIQHAQIQNQSSSFPLTLRDT